MLRWFEHSQVFHPDRVLLATGAELDRPFEDVYFRSGDGIELNGWFFPADANSPRAQMAFLLCHGNAGNISHRLETCRALLETGVAVFSFDYRGYGRSQGRPSEEGTYLDAEAAHEWLERKGFLGKNIIAFGESLGGGIASELAVRKPLAGLVLLSSFSCIPDVGVELFPWLPVRWISRIEYGTCSKLPRLHIPVLVMHSRNDELIRFHHAEKNFRLANEPKMFWELQGNHSTACGEPRNFKEGVEKFLQMIERCTA
jgi:pimeloyl-ACP methyl ester carboxylesterase